MEKIRPSWEKIQSRHRETLVFCPCGRLISKNVDDLRTHYKAGHFDYDEETGLALLGIKPKPKGARWV